MLTILLACTASVDSDSGLEQIPAPNSSIELLWQAQDAGVSTGGAWADIDQDGDFDLVIADGNDIRPGFINVYLNDNGVLPETASWSSNIASFHGQLSTGDLNQDGWIDVVVSRYIGDASFESPGGADIYLNDNGQLPGAPSQVVEGYFSFSNALGDVDLDGDLDLALAVGEGYYNGPMSSVVLENIDGWFASPMWVDQVQGTAYDVEFIDADNDKDLDLIVLDSGAPHRVVENVDGQLAAASWMLGDETNAGNSITLVDIDGNGLLDIVATETAQMTGEPAVRGWCAPLFELCWMAEAPQRYPSGLAARRVGEQSELVTGAWWGALHQFVLDDGAHSPPDLTLQGEWVVETLAWGSLVETVEIETAEWTVETKVCQGPGQIARHYFRDHSGLLCAAETTLLLTDWTDGAGSQLIYLPPLP